MGKATGEVGVDGIFSDFIDQSFEYGNEKYGRKSPVLAPDGSIMLEPGEQLLHQARASGVFELVSPGPDHPMTVDWGYDGVVDIAVTSQRLWFVTDDLPVGFILRKKLQRNGGKLAGHIRWAWIDFLAHDRGAVVLALPRNNNATPQYVGEDRIEGVYSRALRVALAPPAATVSADALYAQVGSAVVEQRRNEPETTDDERQTLEVEAANYATAAQQGCAALPGAVPWPFKSRAEHALPGAAEAIANRQTAVFLREISTPLRVQALSGKEQARVEKALAGWAPDGTKANAVKPWLGKVDRALVLRLASDPNTAPEILDVIAAHGDPEFTSAAETNPRHHAS